MPKNLLLCDCMGSQKLDRDLLDQSEAFSCSRVHTALCTREIETAAKAIQEGDAVIACGQERTRFEDLAAELGAEAPDFIDLRDRAGWTEADQNPAPKMAALLADAALDLPETKSVDVVSEGLCLIFGRADAVHAAAAQLAPVLGVTALITSPDDAALSRSYDIVAGQMRRVTGALGGFEVEIDALQELMPGGRGGFAFTEPRDGGKSVCDIVIDLSGDTPLVQAPEKREGYLRADPKDPAAVARLAFDAAQLSGTFEKPLYVRTEPALCAHSRASQTGCTRCLDICPTGAITPDGDHVSVDPMICAGCGACSALCPSGAITYDDPAPAHLFRRMDVMARAYRAAGGTQPILLVHDTGHGAEMIALAARFGRGLPGHVVPFGLSTIAGFGHAEMLAALASGYAGVAVLLAPTTERDALDREAELAQALASEAQVHLLDIEDPDAFCAALYDLTFPEAVAEPQLNLGTRRQVARQAAKALHPKADAPIDLPQGASYGAVLVDTEACTLCLSCVSLCPSGALADNPDLPQLRFQEDACLQCGLCATICPEDAITLKPQMNTADDAFSQQVLNEEEPFACIECGALFGVRSTVERIMEQLAGKHAMFASSDAAKMIQMCDDCRVKTQFHSADSPFAKGERPRVRTTDDYFSKRRDH